MKNSTLRIIFFIALLCSGGIIATQAYWVTNAYKIADKQFDLNVNIALRDVALKIWELKQSQAPVYNVVERVSKDFYVVQIYATVDKSVLEHYLKESFTLNNVVTDFSFGFHDCMHDETQYQDFVIMDGDYNKVIDKKFEMPKINMENYYFWVQFPDRRDFLSSQLTLWKLSSFILLGVLIFMAYIVYSLMRQKNMSDMQKDFVNNMTHEFKTPLATIQLSTEVLKKPNIADNPSRILNYATIIDNEAKQLQMQVERVLQIAQAEKRNVHINRDEINMQDMLTQVAQSFMTQIENKEGKIELHLSPKPAIVSGDKLHLKNALNNLVDNAIKYTLDAPFISISLKITGQFIKIMVKDNGIGIEKQHLKYVFDRFYRVPTGNIHDVKGFGIGLNYVSSIIQAHNGYIECESKVGEGSTFIIHLPRMKNK